ncbi:MAG: epoxyqueuosine reductase QueH [Clostridia bacterium]|jgi:predicted adenine nucleotide alpha hydrolase (AANH) superfamily ATPase|nr:epoxyqueuosine reductase QueH [Clostridia bacterium]
MRLLLHVCCGPCSIYPVKSLREQGHALTAWFYNPNIHPYTEYGKRRDTFLEYAQKVALPAIIEEGYHLEDFLRKVHGREEEGERCRVCYELRLESAAQAARSGGFDAFTTTLLVSPRQKHDLIREAGERAAQAAGIPFYYEDFRPGYAQAVRISKEESMYRQQYCGCIYSERDRYMPRKKD